MRTSLCVFVVSALVLWPVPTRSAPGLYGTGESLLDECRIAERLWDNPESVAADDGAISDIASAARCTGFVVGVASALDMLGENQKGPQSRFGICLPQGVAYDKLVRIVTKYLRENPQNAHLSATPLTGVALKIAFPCS